MAIGQSKHAIGKFSSRQVAQQALYQLREAGISLDKVSVITKDVNRHQGVNIKGQIGNKAGDVGKMGAIAGTTAGTMLGLVEDLVVLLIPGVGRTSQILSRSPLPRTLLGHSRRHRIRSPLR